MVLAELTCGVAERLEQFGDGRVVGLQPHHGARHPDFGQAGAERVLTADERGASGGAALLAIPVSERHAFVGDAIDVRRPVAHAAAAEVTDVPRADVVTPENQNVRLLCGHLASLSPPNGLTGFLQIARPLCGCAIVTSRVRGRRTGIQGAPCRCRSSAAASPPDDSESSNWARTSANRL